MSPAKRTRLWSGRGCGVYSGSQPDRSRRRPMSYPGYSTYFTVDTSQVLLVALYLRDCAGLRGVGLPALPPVVPSVRTVETRRLTEPAGGDTALRVEWEAWWHSLLGG